ncbi:MAG: NAD(P)H-hydrate dehydratase [Erysipelotrichaceae bacterium]|nr:NAD(P)H-hydrate dehydratase [Erysipelotrichaceae bacterium]
MDEKDFYDHYPVRRADSNKFDNGRVLLVSGSKGMAGSAILNIIGAKSVGTGYIHSLLDETIYPIVAADQVTTVYHPDDLSDPNFIDNLDLYSRVDAIAIGSGLNNNPHGKDYLIHILENFNKPIIVDAYGLDLLTKDESLYSKNNNLILTPHVGEFARMINSTKEYVLKDGLAAARYFAVSKKTILVLKGPHTLVVSPGGEVYENDTGNEALAQAGSGDVLAGMITGLCSIYKDPYQAAVDAVWLHGHVADMHAKDHSKEIFDLKTYPQYTDMFFKERK